MEKKAGNTMGKTILEQITAELNELDNDTIDFEGTALIPSQCYHFDIDPVHVLFNTNCPDSLKQKVNAILSKYVPGHQSA